MNTNIYKITNMFRKQSFDDKTMDTRSEESYDFCNAETSKNSIAKFTPPSDAKIYLRDRYNTTRWLSKTIPRRNRRAVQYKINRSLNFDIGYNRTNDYFTSPNTHVDSSPRNNLYLSRSAKILKALNIDCSPMRSGGYKKINKTLNFDLIPSPKRFSSGSRSHCQMSNLGLTSPGINKTLNFDSPEDSPIINSPHNTSVESMDENQNQTPAERINKVKKSLSYISLSSNDSNKSLDFNLLSPSLRTELREKIDDIVQTSMSPNIQSMRKTPSHEEMNSVPMTVSTPRSLINAFSDDDEDRPETPKNAIRLIPESMSSIKKSHRKERISGRIAQRIQMHVIKSTKMDTAEDEELRPVTPLTSDIHQTPTYNLHSIKKSHKKDKSKRKSCGYRSEDELSETGSLFNYSALEDETKNYKNSECSNDEQTKTVVSETCIDVKKTAQTNTTVQTPLKRAAENEDVTTPSPTTPENHIDYLRRIMTDSIKKSHKKLKESNKKNNLHKTRMLQNQLNDMETNEFSSPENDKKIHKNIKDDNDCAVTSQQCDTMQSNNVDRSTTPENMNSSRLLLAQFSSVKKSHKKNKHRQMSFAQRHIVMTREEDNNLSPPNNNEDEMFNKNSLSTANLPLITITEASTSKSTFGSSFSSLTSDDRNEYRSLGTSPLEMIEDCDIKSLVSSPNKRKSPHNDENGNAESSPSLNNDSCRLYESAGDEFQIFTPIKKRKPLIVLSTPRISNNNNSEIYSENSLSNGRCDTPKIGFNIISLERGNDNKCSEQLINNDAENENGPSTPENNDRFERISALSSIKKSHKKDKWTNARRRSIRMLKGTLENNLECDHATNECPKISNTSIKNWRQSRMNETSSDSGEKTESFDDDISPEPSTSYSDIVVESNSSMKTPPNSLGAKTYLRLIQTTSIKRSHKKMRERKKVESIILDPNLSDDGSIFDETEKSLNYSESNPARLTGNDEDHDEDFMLLDDSNSNNVENKKLHHSKSSHSYDKNRSNDGSISGSEDEMNDPQRS